MPMKVRDAGGSLRTINNMTVLDGGTSRRVVRMKVMDADGVTLRTVATFADQLSLTISPDDIDAFGTTATIVTETATATPSGGFAPFTYAWAKVSGDDITADSSSVASTKFRATNLGQNETRTATFECTATDSAGSTATDTITITILRFEDFR